MYAITGATANIGSKVAEILLARGEKVRVIGRDADRVRQFVSKGAEAAVGDLKDTSFLTEAFRGVDAVFAMIPPSYTVTDFRGYQNDIGRSITDAISKAGVRYVVNLSRALNDGLFAVDFPRTAENTTPTAIEEFADVFAEAFEAAAHKKAAWPASPCKRKSPHCAGFLSLGNGSGKAPACSGSIEMQPAVNG